jgi:hypothetical protein
MAELRDFERCPIHLRQSRNQSRDDAGLADVSGMSANHYDRHGPPFDLPLTKLYAKGVTTIKKERSE